jgi:dihydropteroate synthase
VRGPYLLQMETQADIEALFARIGCDPLGGQIMIKKGETLPLLLKEVRSPGANILKQQMLSLGGEAVVSRGVVNCSQEYTDVLLLGTVAIYEALVYKLQVQRQPWGLGTLGGKLQELLAKLEKARRQIVWEWPDRKLVLGEKVLVMGILNVTPDSFSDGGKFHDIEKALAHARQMVEDGADIIDLGGESTRPGYTVVPAEEELARVMPVLEKLVKELPVPLSLDTSKAKVAEAALAAGVHIINYEGVGEDSPMAQVAARYQAPVIIMHNPRTDLTGHSPVNGWENNSVNNPVYNDVIPDLLDNLAVKIGIFEAAGVEPEKIMTDPGIGFGKSQEENLMVLKRLKSLRTLGKPVLLGVSRKSFLGHILDLPVGERLEGSLAGAAWGIMHGADVLRVHDVRETVRLVKVLEAIKRAGA